MEIHADKAHGCCKGTDGDKPATAVIDPVCGMTVDPATARGKVDYQGRTYYFCSTSCVGKFQADPTRYLNQPSKEQTQ